MNSPCVRNPKEYYPRYGINHDPINYGLIGLHICPCWTTHKSLNENSRSKESKRGEQNWQNQSEGKYLG